MIELKTNVEQLDGIAANEISAGRDGNGSDIKAAALDHRNLQEYAERLERNIQEMSAEIQKYKSLAVNLHDVMRDNIADQIEENPPRVDDDHIRSVVREMIRDGDITAEVDYSNVELELTLNA